MRTLITVATLLKLMRKHVIGNWKMNGTWAELDEVLESLISGDYPCNITICPPYPYLAATTQKIAHAGLGVLAVGAQNVSQFEEGAYTGEVSATMLKDCGCSVVVIGHSERRRYFAENELDVESKIRRALACSLSCVMCVGETGFERDAGTAEEKIQLQLAPAIKMLAESPLGLSLSIAYEPIWAIGTGVAASGEQIVSMHEFIKGLVGDVPVLYGGSVVAGNAQAIMQLHNVDGVLVGGASLNAAEFSSICYSAIG